MSLKISTVRRAAYLKALAETGNVTLAAERARVSRRWAQVHRLRDAEFDAACAAALREAGERLGAHPERRPPSGWGHLDGEELVVKGTRGRAPSTRVQIARARLNQISPSVEDRFLATLAATCNVKAAYTQAGVTKRALYAHRQRWPAFAAKWDQAVGTGYARIEMALVQNGCNVFSGEELPPDMPIPPITAEQAIHLLHMHKNKVHGIGRRPGREAPVRDIIHYKDSIMRKIRAVQRESAMSDEEKALERSGWALRRRLGQARD